MRDEDDLTAEWATAAATGVLEEGLDFAAARERAARSMGLDARRVGGLRPDDARLEDEIRLQIRLFHAETQPAELAALRLLARDWMQRLGEFRPHLAGAVWRGIANRLSAIRLELYADDIKEVAIALANLGLDPDVADTEDRRPGRRGAVQEVLVLQVPSRIRGGADFRELLGPDVTLHLIVGDHDALRGALKPDAQGRSWRGDLDALARLTEADAR